MFLNVVSHHQVWIKLLMLCERYWFGELGLLVQCQHCVLVDLGSGVVCVVATLCAEWLVFINVVTTPLAG